MNTMINSKIDEKKIAKKEAKHNNSACERIF